jgi:hypothetical protein
MSPKTVADASPGVRTTPGFADRAAKRSAAPWHPLSSRYLGVADMPHLPGGDYAA